MLADAGTPNAPGWWLLRLGQKLQDQIPRFDTLDSYWRGEHPLPFGNQKMREAYRRFQRQSRTNFTKLVAESVCERLKVTGFRTGSPTDDGLDKEAWGWWQDNHLDADAGLVHRAAVVMSRAYVIVGPDPDDNTQPLVTAEDPRQVMHESAATNRRRLLAAVKTWWDDIESRQLAVLYLPDAVHYFRAEQTKEQVAPEWKATRWEIDDSDEYPQGMGTNPLGVVPVVPFFCCPDLKGNTLGEFEDVTAIQDRINTQVLDRLVISTMQAYRQRWSTGVELVDAKGQPIGGFDPGADLLWNVPDDKARFGEFQPADLTSVLKAVESDVQHLAAITRTPPHYLLGGIINASGDALSAAETGLVSKVGERATEFGEAWERVYWLAGLVQGRQVPSECEVIWDDAQFRTLTEMAAANVQLVTAGVPWRTRMSLLKFTPSQIERMVTERTQDALLNAVLTPALPAGGTGGAPAPGGQGGAAVPASAAARAALPAGSRNGRKL